MFWLILKQVGRNANPNADPPVEARERIDAPTNATFKITDIKLYVSVATLSTKSDKKLLEQLKTRFKRIMTSQTKNKNLNYLIDPTFTKVNRMFVFLFENEDDRTYFSKYYVPSF